MTIEKPRFTVVAGTDVGDAPAHSEKTKPEQEPAQCKRRRSRNPLIIHRATVCYAVSVFGRAQKFGPTLTPQRSENFEDLLRRGALAARVLQDELSKAADELREARSERTDQQRLIEKYRQLSPEEARIVDAEVQRMMEERQP